MIPDSVTKLAYSAFYHCNNLTDVTVGDGLDSISACAFESCANLNHIKIQDGVTSIGFCAFDNCKSLVDVTIPSTVTHIDRSAFNFCTGLTSFNVDSHNSVYASVDGVLFDKAMAQLIQYPANRPGANYAVPDGVQVLSADAFSCCKNLTSVTLPTSLTNIGPYAFEACEDLTDVYYAGDPAQWAAISIGESNDPLASAAIHYNYVPTTTGHLGSGGELSWAYHKNTHELRVAGAVPEEDLVLVGLYDKDGQFVGVKCLSADRLSAQLGDPASFKLFWIDSGLAPQCAAVTVEN